MEGKVSTVVVQISEGDWILRHKIRTYKKD